jgi:hypothetical protein
MIAHFQCEPSSRLRILFSSFCLLPAGLGLNVLSWARPAPSHIPLLFRFVVSAQAVWRCRVKNRNLVPGESLWVTHVV